MATARGRKISELSGPLGKISGSTTGFPPGPENLEDGGVFPVREFDNTEKGKVREFAGNIEEMRSLIN